MGKAEATTAPENYWRTKMQDQNPQALSVDDLDDAIVGIAVRCGQPALYVYDSQKCVEVLMRNNKWSEEEALEWFSFNIEGAWLGEHTPLFADFSKEED